jgi:hypothetical protein
VESVETQIEHQIQSVLDVFSLLFGLLSANELNLSGLCSSSRMEADMSPSEE